MKSSFHSRNSAIRMITPMRLVANTRGIMNRLGATGNARCVVTGLLALCLAGCVSLSMKKHTYGGGGRSVEVNGARVALAVKPEGAESGSYMVSAMVVSAGAATMDGPFRWRIEAIGDEGVHEELVVTSLHTRTGKTGLAEEYPREKLGQRALFRPLADQPGKARARFLVPGLLQVKPREDGRLTVTAGVAVKAKGRWKRAKVKFHLDPDEKRETETIFLPAEIVRSFGTDPADWDEPGWD
jgi:hypothetical protein